MAELTTAQQIAAGMSVNTNIISITAPNPSGDSSRIGISNPAAAPSSVRAGIVSNFQSQLEREGYVIDRGKSAAPSPLSAAVMKGQDIPLPSSHEAWMARNADMDPYSHVGGEKKTRYTEAEMQMEYAKLYAANIVPADQGTYERFRQQNIDAGITITDATSQMSSEVNATANLNTMNPIVSAGLSSISPTIKNQFTKFDPKVWGLGAPTTAKLPSGGSNTANFANLVPTGTSTGITPRVRSITYTPSSYETRGMRAGERTGTDYSNYNYIPKDIETVVGKDVVTISPSLSTFSRDVYENNQYAGSVIDPETKQAIKDLTKVESPPEGMEFNPQQSADAFLKDNPDFVAMSTAGGVVLTRDIKATFPDIKVTSTYNPAPTEGFKTGEGSKLELTPNTYNEYFADQFKRDVQAARNLPLIGEDAGLLAGSKGLGNFVRENTAESFALMPMINLLPEDIKTSVSKGLAGYTGDVLAQTGETLASPATFFVPLAYNVGAKLNYETYNVPFNKRYETLAGNVGGTTALVGLGVTSFLAASTEQKLATAGGIAYAGAVYAPSLLLSSWTFGAAGMSLGKGVDYVKTKYAQYKVAKDIRGTNFQIQTSSADIEYGKFLNSKENANFLMEGTRIRQSNVLDYMKKEYNPDLTQDLFTNTKNPAAYRVGGKWYSKLDPATDALAQGKLVTAGKIITPKGTELKVYGESYYSQVFQKSPETILTGAAGKTNVASPYMATPYDTYPEFAAVTTNIQITGIGGKPIYNYEGLTSSIYGGKTGELGFSTGITKGAGKSYEFYQVAGTNPTLGQTSQLGNIQLNYKGTYANPNNVNTIFFNQGAPIGAKPVAADFGIVFQEKMPTLNLYPESVIQIPTGRAPFRSPYTFITPSTEGGAGAVGSTSGTSSNLVASGNQFMVQSSQSSVNIGKELTKAISPTDANTLSAFKGLPIMTGKDIAKSVSPYIKQNVIAGYTDKLLRQSIGNPTQYETLLSGAGTKAGLGAGSSSSYALPISSPSISIPRTRELELTQTFTTPFTTPKFSPMTSPKILPVTEPKIAPVNIPVNVPVITPFTIPFTVPVTVPITTPITTPLTIPMTTPLTTPMTTPVTTPVGVPFIMPTFAPTRYPPPLFIPSLGGGGGGKKFNPFSARPKLTRATPSFFAAFTKGKSSKAPKGFGGLDFGVFTRGLGAVKKRKKKRGRK